MLVTCVDCASETPETVGYCHCGGVRIANQPITDADAASINWPGSPLIRSRIPGLEDVYLKYENGHLTGSFKDRIMRVAVARAMNANPVGAVVPSSGNAALSAAAAGARLGLPIYAIVPRGSARERIAPVLARGAVVIEAGSDPSEAYAAADRVAAELGLTQLYSTFAAPMAEWACRMIGVEAVRQLGRTPSAVVAPISAGPVLVGAAHGMAQESGSGLPPLIAVQPDACCPIAKAYRENKEIVEPWLGEVNTIATSITDRLNGYPQDGTYTLRLIRVSGGLAASVSDAEMRDARSALLRYDGVDAELSASAGVAFLMRRDAGLKGPVVAVVTASGFKHTYREDAPDVIQSNDQAKMAQQISALVSGRLIDAQNL
jgi:threonine synthase